MKIGKSIVTVVDSVENGENEATNELRNFYRTKLTPFKSCFPSNIENSKLSSSLERMRDYMV